MALEFDPGRYWCKVTDQGLGLNSKDNEQFYLKFEVVGRINPADPEGQLLDCPQGKERTVYRVITAKTFDWLKRDLKYLCECGKLTPKFGGVEMLDPRTPGFVDFTNIEFETWCEHDTYEGKTRERWNIESGGGEVKPLDDKAIRKLNAMFGKELASLGPPPQAATPAKTTRTTCKTATAAVADSVESPPFNEVENTKPDDDIPF